MREKVIKNRSRDVVYTRERWKILNRKREIAHEIMERIQHLNPLLLGSLARGDVHTGSDIDIVILNPIASYELEIAFESIYRRRIVQATPWLTPKAHVYLSEDTCVTFPLKKLSEREEEFYRFGGIINLSDLEENRRVPGVNKKLLFIEPTKDGHREISINLLGESEVARRLGVSLDIVRERVYVLTRRDSIGRTGVYINYELRPEESFEEVIHYLKRYGKGYLKRDRKSEKS